MENFFSIDTSILGNMSDIEAVVFFHALLHAEATRIGGVDKSKVSVPHAITVPDGGIDAEVQDASPGSLSQGVIKNGTTAYQIKTGAFKVNSLAKARKIIQKDRVREFKTRIKTCLENDDTLVVVLFGNDDPDATGDTSLGYLREAIAEVDSTYENARLEIWNQNQLKAFLLPYPSLRIRLQGRPPADIYDIDGWMKIEGMGNEMFLGDDQKRIIDSIRTGIQNHVTEPIRVLGDPGIGKTRSTLEALSTDDLAPLVIYFQSPSKIPAGLQAELIRPDNNYRIVMVVDECDATAQYQLATNLGSIFDRLNLITIYNEYERGSSDTLQVTAVPLEDGKIEEILTSPMYSIPTDDAQRLAPLCGGSPRVAHIIAKDVKDTGVVSVDHDVIWERYIKGGDSSTEEFNKRLSVLQYLALFKRFGFGPPNQNEGMLIAAKIESDLGITQGEFRTIVEKLRNRKILQGEATLYITPILLQIYLWKGWWLRHGQTFTLQSFQKIDESSQLSDKLIDWFFDMLKYGREYPEASSVVEGILSDDGVLGDSRFLDSERGSKLIRVLSEVDQEAVLKFIERELGSMSGDDLQSFAVGRRGMIHALESIAMDPLYFVRAAKALLRLAEHENETWANNATGIFTDLFSNGPGGVAPTGASPEERFPVLRDALHSTSDITQKIAIDAVSKGLEAWHFSRISGAEYYGLNGKFELWKPKTYGELWDAYRRNWNALYDALPEFNEENRVKAGEVLSQSIRGMLLHLNIRDEIIGWVRSLIESEYVSNGEITKEVVLILNYDRKRLPDGVVKQLEEIHDQLSGETFTDILHRYVGLSIIEDEYDENGNKKDIVPDKLSKLAEQALDNPTILNGELEWLTSDKPENAYSFGFELGKLDVKERFLSAIINTQRQSTEASSVHFLSGYLQSLRRRDTNRREEILDEIAPDPSLRPRIAEITWRSGMTDRAMQRVLETVKDGTISADELRMFGYGSAIEPLSPKMFEELLEFVLNCHTTRSPSIALDFASFYYETKKLAIIPEGLGLDVILEPSLFVERQEHREHMDDFYWHRVAELYIKQYPHREMEIARKLIENLGNDNSIINGYRDDPIKILNEITKRHPEEIWDLISDYVSPIKDSHGLHVMWWLNGGMSFGTPRPGGAINLFPPEILWKWVDADVEDRAKRMAAFVPQDLFSGKDHVSLAREMLVRYGDREDVINEFNTNNFNEGWSGEASDHYRGKKYSLLKLKENETDKNVIRWIDQYARILDDYIKKALLEEERRDF